MVWMPAATRSISLPIRLLSKRPPASMTTWQLPHGFKRISHLCTICWYRARLITSSSILTSRQERGETRTPTTISSMAKTIYLLPVTRCQALPGIWTVQNRQSPTEFKSTDPPGSPFWYPPTHINYAILYHWGGFFVHDAWWRVNYGPGTQFPHYDTGGDETFSGNGSHGCINMQEDQAAWVYNHTNWNTIIAVY